MVTAQSTSNGERSLSQSRAELAGNSEWGVETCTESHRVVAATKCSTVVGEVPTLLNGGHETRAHQSPTDSRWDSPILQATGEPAASSHVRSSCPFARTSPSRRRSSRWVRCLRSMASTLGPPMMRKRSSSSSTVNSMRSCSTSTPMQAVVKSISNGEHSLSQSRAELDGNVERGVETCTESHRVVAGTKCSTVAGAEPALLNGGRETRAGRSSIESRRYSPILQVTGAEHVVAADPRRAVVVRSSCP